MMASAGPNKVNGGKKVCMKRGEHPVELEVQAESIDLHSERSYAHRMLQPPPECGNETNNSGFYRLKLLPEEYRYAEYCYAENEPYRVYFHNVCNRWFVYKTYQRVDELFLNDNFNAKSYYMGLITEELMQREDFLEINDFLSVASVLHGENERKKELRFGTGNGFRLSERSMKGRKMSPTYLASHAREMRIGPAMLKVVVHSNVREIAKYQRERMAKMEQLMDNMDLAILARFLEEHQDWVKSRKSMSDYEILQHKVRRTVPFKRRSATRLVALPGVSVSDLYNELIDFPTWTGYHFYYMRVCNKNGVNIVYDDIDYAVSEDKRLRHLRVKVSRYSHGPQAVSTFGTAKVYSGDKMNLDYSPISKRPPSVASVSGVSTITKMSTATTSPNSWQNDWTMQATHDDYDHRLTETTIANPRDTHAVGAEQFAIRLNNEINSRIGLLVTDMDTVATTLNLNSRMDPRIVCACEFQSPPAMLESAGDLRWLRNAESCIEQIVAKSQPSIDDKKDLKVLLYAKQRYEQPLSAYDRSTEQPGETAQENDFAGPEATMSPGRASKHHLFLNESWRRTIDTNRLPPNVISVLKLLVTDAHSWTLDSDNSNITLVRRCDKLCKSRVDDFFHRFFMSDRQTNLLAVGTLFLFLFQFIFFLFGHVIEPNSPEDDNIGYCPSSQLGFNTHDPKQVAAMREVYDIQESTYRIDTSAAAKKPFYLL